MTFEHGKTYCELCLDQIDPFVLNDGYTVCCNERPVGAREARRIQKDNDEYEVA
jgi:hypothetical protein